MLLKNHGTSERAPEESKEGSRSVNKREIWGGTHAKFLSDLLLPTCTLASTLCCKNIGLVPRVALNDDTYRGKRWCVVDCVVNAGHSCEGVVGG